MNIDKEKILKAINEFLVEFGKEYTKAFAIALVKDILAGEQKGEEKEARQLRHYIPVPPNLEGPVKVSSDGGAKTSTSYFKVTDKWQIAVYPDEKKKK